MGRPEKHTDEKVRFRMSFICGFFGRFVIACRLGS